MVVQHAARCEQLVAMGAEELLRWHDRWLLSAAQAMAIS